MKFNQTEDDINYPLKRYVSENNLWEFGWRSLISGFQFCANPVGGGRYTIEYGGGSNTLFNACLNGLMLQIFELLPESITEKEFTSVFPKNSRIKPMNKDAAWQMLNIQFKHLKLVDGNYNHIR